jgi:hypothetical protein
MKLPNPAQVVVDMQKLTGYCLNPIHSDGQHKAYVFQSVLGLGIEDAEILRDALLEAVKINDAVLGQSNAQGQKYVIDFSMTFRAKQAIVRSAWMIRLNEDFPRLITCYILKNGRLEV